VLVNDKKYTLAKTGHFILNDPLTKVNMDFINDVNYNGLAHFDERIETGKPAGLKEFGSWKTIYEGLSQLPEQVQKSWFAFDYFFSDDVFLRVLPLVYGNSVKKLLDVGGNTGKWAIASANHYPGIHITIVDLPGQINVAKTRVKEAGLQDRISFLPVNILDDSVIFPTGYDAIWFSQCLDCFSEKEIVSILKKCYEALDENGQVIILEPFLDRQKFEIAAFCLQQTTVYFTTLANGNIQVYSTETFFKCVEQAGFKIVEEINNIGLSQTLLKCKKPI
jgi:ubiquinone/menaquinone biosynthesis C-methylase UbiE